MLCPMCKIEMAREEILVSKATSPYEEDHFELMWICESCDHIEPLEIHGKEDEDDF